MHLATLELVDFRSYPHVTVSLQPGVTVIVGANGQGKTNLVEAVGYLAAASSHRVAVETPLVRAGAASALIRGLVIRDERQLLLELELHVGKANRGRLNKSPLPRSRDLIGVLRTVTFAPEDVSLVRGDPEQRRRFVDELLTLRTPRYAGVRADYERVLKQRNALLKSAGGSSGQLDEATLAVWDDHLVQTGSELLHARLTLVAELLPFVESAYEDLATAGGPAALRYKASWFAADDAAPEGVLDVPSGTSMDRGELVALLRRALDAARREEVARGLTVVGPHRDDLLLILGALPARGYASHGESWSMALALRLASFSLLRAQGDDPVLILDDVFAELDQSRRDRLAAMVGMAEQVLVTAAVVEDVPATLGGVRMIVADGQVSADD